MFDSAPRSARPVTSCGCVSPSRWQCPLCDPRRGVFLSCSCRCLEAHRSARHRQDAVDQPYERARYELRTGNQNNERNWDLYQGHRYRLTRLLEAVQRGEGLCVLGAGNGDDLDLPRLVRAFGEVHLVDLDGEALARALARVSEPQRRKITVHADVDLGGLLESIEGWADDFPREAQWPALADAAGARIAARVGRRFDVVLSDCIVSQLAIPFYRALVARPPEWAALMRAIGRAHVGAMGSLLSIGGTGVLLGDFPHAPGSGGSGEISSWDTLDPEVLRRLTGGIQLLRKPAVLMELAGAPDLPVRLDLVRLTEPWGWMHGQGLQVAYGVLFKRPDESAGACAW
jgi:hypothetical protein